MLIHLSCKFERSPDVVNIFIWTVLLFSILLEYWKSANHLEKDYFVISMFSIFRQEGILIKTGL